MRIEYDQATQDLVNNFMAFIMSDIVVANMGKWTVCHIRAEMSEHLKMREWCSVTLGKQHRGVKTGIFKLFAIPGRWYYDQATFDILNNGVKRRYWFKNSSDFEMFKLVWFDELTGK